MHAITVDHSRTVLPDDLFQIVQGKILFQVKVMHHGDMLFVVVIFTTNIDKSQAMIKMLAHLGGVTARTIFNCFG